MREALMFGFYFALVSIVAIITSQFVSTTPFQIVLLLVGTFCAALAIQIFYAIGRYK